MKDKGRMETNARQNISVDNIDQLHLITVLRTEK
jgi:hypothetical protein